MANLVHDGEPLPARQETVVGQLVDVGSLAELAAGVAGDQAAQLTRRTYAGVYRAFCAFVGPGAGPEALTRATVRAYREDLERAGRSPATIAKHLSALRTLAAELGADDVHNVRSGKVARGAPRAQRAARPPWVDTAGYVLTSKGRADRRSVRP